jgi:outer membrane lipoprotein-sorting protein
MARIELTGASRELGYEKIILWLSEPDVILRRMEFFKQEAEPAKVLVFDRIQEVAGIPTAHRLEMSQPVKRSSTSIELKNVQYNIGLSDALFTDRALEHALDEVE